MRHLQLEETTPLQELLLEYRDEVGADNPVVDNHVVEVVDEEGADSARRLNRVAAPPAPESNEMA